MTSGFVGPLYDIGFSVLAVAHVVLVVLAFRTWFSVKSPGLYEFIGALIILFVPVIGPIPYLLARGRASRTSSSPS